MPKRSPTLFIRCKPKNLRLMAIGVNFNPRLYYHMEFRTFAVALSH